MANFYQLINCCNILCVTEYVTMYLYFISGYYNTEYAWSSYTYQSSCTYMQIRRVDLSCMSGLPTFHMLPTPLMNNGMTFQLQTLPRSLWSKLHTVLRAACGRPCIVFFHCCNVNAAQYQSSSYAYSSMSLYGTKCCMDHTPVHLPTDSLLAGCAERLLQRGWHQREPSQCSPPCHHPLHLY